MLKDEVELSRRQIKEIIRQATEANKSTSRKQFDEFFKACKAEHINPLKGFLQELAKKWKVKNAKWIVHFYKTPEYLITRFYTRRYKKDILFKELYFKLK